MSRVATQPAAASAGLAIGALVLATLIPLAPDQVLFPPLNLGLLVFAVGLCGLALTFAAASALAGTRRDVSARLEAASLWGACGLALVGAIAAVASSAETLSLQNIVLAQQNTSLNVLRQPAAAAIFVVALALAAQEPALRAVLGPPARARHAAQALVLVVLAAFGATLFLGGFAGAWLPAPLWVVVKTAIMLTLLLLARRQLAGLADGPRLAIAWLATLVGVVNLAISLVRATS